MTTIERILRELGRDTLRSMTQMQAAAYGYELAERLCLSESAKSDTQPALPRTDDTQPVGGDIIAARMDKPALSAILPRRPNYVPAPPDGWDYVGMGRGENSNAAPSQDIALHTKHWDTGDEESCGHLTGWHYAIRRTAPPDIWHRFGILAPEEGGGFYPHMPGDPCPCDGEMRVQTILHAEQSELMSWNADICPASEWAWGDCGSFGIVGWRPALGGAK
jgi:hypothetical protein